MNFVFWLIVILVMVFVWFQLSDSFWGIGNFFTGLVDDAKEGMNADEESEEYYEEKDDAENGEG